MQRNYGNDNERQITVDIIEHIGVIEVKPNGWRKELNIVRWNNADVPKFDIREWDVPHTKMSKGITLHAYEMNAITDLYTAYRKARTAQAEAEMAAAFPKTGAAGTYGYMSSIGAAGSSGGTMNGTMSGKDASQDEFDPGVYTAIPAGETASAAAEL